MTLILTVLTPLAVVQASDRRLTWPDGRVEDDHANKVVCGTAATGPFVISYSGLAELPSLPSKPRTDEWILDELTRVSAAQHDLPTIVDGLASSLGAVFEGLDSNLRQTPTCIAISGYIITNESARPILYEVANYSEGSRPNEKFSGRWWALKADADPRSAILVHPLGYEPALIKPLRKRLRKLCHQRFFHKNEPAAVATTLVSMIRIAASAPEAMRNPRGESVIGKDCLSVWLTPTSATFKSSFHSFGADPTSYGPALYCGDLAFKGLQTWSGTDEDEIPDWSAFSKSSKYSDSNSSRSRD